MERFLEQYIHKEIEDNNSVIVDELLRTLEWMEEEYQRTQSPELKLKMVETAKEINDLLLKK